MPSERMRQQVEAELIAEHESKITEAFMAAVDQIVSTGDMSAGAAAFDGSDPDGVAAALGLSFVAFSGLHDAMVVAFAESGRLAAEGLPKRSPDGRRIIVRFDARDMVAEQLQRRYGGDLTARLDADARRVIGILAEAGEPGRGQMWNLIGRLNRVTGKREGGLIGLSPQQAQWAMAAADELASREAAKLRNYLARNDRSRRFDRSVTKAIREGSPLPARIAEQASVQYRKNLLRRRGATIGQVVAVGAIEAGKFEAHRQAGASGQLAAAIIDRDWRAVGDLRTRHTHRRMNGQERGLLEPFVSPSGARLMHPGDTSLGAPVSEIVNCRCGCRYRVRFPR